MRAALATLPAPKVAVSPIIAGRALKGPADRMLDSLGHEPTALGVARIYAGLVDRFVLDEADAHWRPRSRRSACRRASPTVMRDDRDRRALADDPRRAAVQESLGTGASDSDMLPG